MGMKNNTITDRRILKERNKMVDDIGTEIYEAQQYFPDAPLEILKQCGWSIMSDTTQANTLRVQPKEKYILMLNLALIEDLDEMVECLMHELAHIYLGHFDEKNTPAIIARQEKECETQTIKWFNEYYFNKKSAKS